MANFGPKMAPMPIFAIWAYVSDHNCGLEFFVGSQDTIIVLSIDLSQVIWAIRLNFWIWFFKLVLVGKWAWPSYWRQMVWDPKLNQKFVHWVDLLGQLLSRNVFLQKAKICVHMREGRGRNSRTSFYGWTLM